MCGIAGKINFDSSQTIQEIEIRSMIDTLSLRGPDDEGIYLDRNVGLGFKRLSIIDLNTGHQPLSNSDKTLWITFNGEIYNFQELRTSLQKKGYKFITKSDTEVIVNLYQEYGVDCVQHLRGMFAFVIYDIINQKIFGARDRFGIKPLFYMQTNNSFSWASEIKALKKHSEFTSEINLRTLDYYFTYGYSPWDESIYRSVKKLLPGSYFILDLNKKDINVKKYWKIDFQPDYSISISDWKEKILEEFKSAVNMRMISDVPLGAFLSGGIDSSAVVAIMAGLTNLPIKTFSIGFKEKQYSELDKARVIAKKYDTEHYEMIVEPESIELISTLVKAYDEPFADSSAIPTYILSKFTREHVTVALSGDGGDELFAGYNHLIKMYKIGRNPFYNNLLCRSVFKGIHKIIPDFIPSKGLTYYLSKSSRYIGAYHCQVLRNYERWNLYTGDLQKKLAGIKSEESRKNLIDNLQGDLLSLLQGELIETNMVDDILTKVDRASMANSLEVRVPILDHKLAELSFKIPSNYKYYKGQKKYIFKEALESYLPDEIMCQQKKGFGVPLGYWFNRDLFEYVKEKLNSSTNIYNYLDKKQVSQLLTYHSKGLRDYGQKIWAILIFEEWLEQQ